MKKSLLIMISLLILCNISYAAPKKADWHDVLTNNNIVYSVDMNTIAVKPDGVMFWSLMDNHSNNQVTNVRIAVNTKEKICRFEEGIIYDKKTNRQILKLDRPMEWKKLVPGSSMERMVNYVLSHHREIKNDLL
ncbi:Hypothetical protein LUCI_2555 [Lucifera butyrica]|uniref:Uncharacterized protein n=1 Tax=Lucifera butyrica TaxID=1351585 RepID=A0A498R7F6_9FIRM|nr:hypothetical protein [Lucifera butyrica]VBB07311.1 Hypothetical protein LUCI_2555 [Lucifera butyrica]